MWAWASIPTDKWQALFNTLLVVIGFLQWRVYNRQATIMSGQRDIAAEQAAISKRQTNIQQAVADLERPTLFVTRLDTIEFRPVEKDPSSGMEWCEPVVRMHFANFGRTPAVLLGIEGEILLARKPPCHSVRPVHETATAPHPNQADGGRRRAPRS